ncbi:MAG: hypothetical protein ACAI38_01755 [Myxococcota bacterium]
MGIENRAPTTLSASQPVWNMETGASAARGGQATLGQVLSAFSDPQFSGIASRSPDLAASVRALQTDGATIPELHDFDRQVHAVPGALQGFERALERVAPHLR